MKRDFYVYQWIRPDTGAPFYIGKGCGERDGQHKKHNPIFMHIVGKLEGRGLSPVVVRIREGLTEAEAFDLERAEIVKHGRINIKTGTLANLTDGGEGAAGRQHSEATRAAISKAKTGKKVRPMSEDGRRNLSAALRGKPKSAQHRLNMSAANKGRAPSREAQLKAWSANTGRKPSDETRAKLSAWQIGRQLTAEHKKKLSDLRIGTKATAEARAKMSEVGRGKPKAAEHILKVVKALRKKPNPTVTASGLKGVVPRGERWCARITVNGRRRHLGMFATAELAGRAYDAAAIDAWGRGNCYLNFPDEAAAC